MFTSTLNPVKPVNSPSFLPQVTLSPRVQISLQQHSQRDHNNFSSSNLINIGRTNSFNKARMNPSPLPFESAITTPRKQTLLPPQERFSANNQSESSLSRQALSPRQNLPPLKIPTPRLLNQNTLEAQDLYLSSARDSTTRETTLLPTSQQTPTLSSLKTQSSLKKLESLSERKALQAFNPLERQQNRENIAKFNVNLAALWTNRSQNDRESTIMFQEEGDDSEDQYDTKTNVNPKKLSPIKMDSKLRTKQTDEYALTNAIQLNLQSSELSVTDQEINEGSILRLKVPNKPRKSILKIPLFQQERSALEVLGDLTQVPRLSVTEREINDSPAIKYASQNTPRKRILKLPGAQKEKSALEVLGELYLKGELSNLKKNLEQDLLEDLPVAKSSLGEKITESSERSESEDEDEDEENNIVIGLKLPKIETSKQFVHPRKSLLVKLANVNRSNSLKPLKSNNKVNVTFDQGNPKENVKVNRKDILAKLRKSYKIKFIASLLSNTEKKQKRKSKILQKAKVNLRNLLWALFYPSALRKHIENKVFTKKQNILKEMSNYIRVCFKDLENLFVSIGEKYIRNLICETKSLELFSTGKLINDKVLDVRANFIFTNLHGLFDKLIVRMTQDSLPNHLIKFLILMSQDYGVVPQDFLFDFELKRLQFNHYGNLKNMSPQKSKMIIGSFILLRVLIYKIIMRPWTVFPDIIEKKVNKKNLLTIGSILYHKVLNLYKRTLPIQHNNQSFLHPNQRLKARKEPLRATDEEPDEQELLEKKSNMSSEKDKEGIKGFLSQEHLKFFFSDRKKYVDQLKAIIEGWHDKIYEITLNDYLKMPKNDIGKVDIPQETINN